MLPVTPDVVSLVLYPRLDRVEPGTPPSPLEVFTCVSCPSDLVRNAPGSINNVRRRSDANNP